MLAGDECVAKCADGYDGEVIATCRADGGFAIDGSCQPIAEDDDRQGKAGAWQHRVRSVTESIVARSTPSLYLAVLPAAVTSGNKELHTISLAALAGKMMSRECIRIRPHCVLSPDTDVLVAVHH